MFKILILILCHPLNTGLKGKLKSIKRIFVLNFKRFILRSSHISFGWINHSKLTLSNNKFDKISERQIKFNYYLGLSDYEEMSFLMHCLKKKNIFIDCGANIGLYSILSSKVVGAKSIAFEPHPKTVKKLIYYLNKNKISNKVKIIQKAIGEKNGVVKFSNIEDSLKRKIISSKKNNKNCIEVSLTKLDLELSKKIKNQEIIVKLDLEGNEFKALMGARKLLKNKNLKALIVENYDKKTSIAVNKLLNKNGFLNIQYFPLQRKIKIKRSLNFKNMNNIYIKNFNKIRKDCLSSKKIFVRNLGISI